jgi:hypothetical protein
MQARNNEWYMNVPEWCWQVSVPITYALGSTNFNASFQSSPYRRTNSASVGIFWNLKTSKLAEKRHHWQWWQREVALSWQLDWSILQWYLMGGIMNHLQVSELLDTSSALSVCWKTINIPKTGTPYSEIFQIWRIVVHCIRWKCPIFQSDQSIALLVEKG